MYVRPNTTAGQTTRIESDRAAWTGEHRLAAGNKRRHLVKSLPPPIRAPFGSAKRLMAARRQKGVYMVELLIALGVSTLLSAALVSSMAESERLANVGQNLIVATTIAQGQIDSTRNTPYNSLAASIGNHELKVRASSLTGSLIPVVSPRPLLLDSAKFEGRVFETIAAGPFADTLKVTITINWVEGPAARTYSLTTLVAKNGINNTGTQATGGV